MVAHLLACGSTACSQLLATADPSSPPPASCNILLPRRIASCEHGHLKILFSGWSDLIIKETHKIHAFGPSRKLENLLNGDQTANGQSPSNIKQIFGDFSGPRGIIYQNGDAYKIELNESDASSGGTLVKFDAKVEFVAIAGNDGVCIVKDHCRVYTYPTSSAFLTHASPSRSYHIPTTRIVSLIANETSFALLSSEGEVYTWGDARYSLGREINPEQPASDPCVVEALEGMRIIKIASGGWISAAVSESRDLYIWGNSTGFGEEGKDGIEGLPEEMGEVGLVDLREGVDIVDVAVGLGHLAVLTTRGDVWATGRNANGQCGVGGENFVGKWTKWEKTWEGEAKGIFTGSTACATSLCVKP